ncbi:MAG: hypothetical protein IKN99_01980 [Bacteroidales bacterium]|nr:hypothetical protein [Bacteroidales bacterium]
MKNISLLIVVLLVSIVSFAQNDVTKFLGIPVDGTKSDMIQKLKTKGFTYDAVNDVLHGQFNGRKSNIYIATNKGKVCRIMVCDDIGISEAEIKIRFNNLCRQFENNEKYIHRDLLGSYEIGEDVDISYEMLVHNKRFQAAYYQISENDNDSTDLMKFLENVQNHYTEEELENLSEEEAKMMLNQFWDSLNRPSLHKSVWFMISRNFNRYNINIYYDNELNMANGEDL